MVAHIEDAVTGSTVLSIAVREHYQKRHPETRDTWIEAASFPTLVDPDRAMVNTTYPNTVNVFRSIGDTDDMTVSLIVATHPQGSSRVQSLQADPKARIEERWNNTGRRERRGRKAGRRPRGSR